ncbi:hypothetical protein FKW77_002180 [Venturia effusa]|uniref:C2H2-type domain-containing protein n=1 Tax=Venturia effusa TaxID=50376 RepID=A0A517L6S5_9PEZI|nr:hypothetical protein FKW77_002180 [Venturia effusa]
MPTQDRAHEQSSGNSPSSDCTSSYIDEDSNADYIDGDSNTDSQQEMAQTSSHGYAASYATSPPEVGSPSMPQRGGSSQYDARPDYQYSSAIRSPSYHGDTSSPQGSYPYATAQGLHYVPAYSVPPHYTNTQYAPAYAGYSPSYQQPHTPGAMASQQHYGSAYHQSSPGYVDATGVRVVHEPPGKTECWDHGCQGRKFSTFSNFLRHQREKNGDLAKVRCERCGTEFTRTTAKKSHMRHNKCKKRPNGSPPS